MLSMKSALSLTLIGCFVASALPVAAQEPTVTRGSLDLRRGLASQGPAGPLARAVTREAVRLAADGASASAEAVPAGNTPGTSDWSRVRKLARGKEIILTVKGSTPVRRYLIAADESGLTLGDRKVADLGRGVENIARTDVAKIETLGTSFWSSVHRHAKIGLGVGAAIGLVAGLASRSECGSGCVPAFAFGGSLMGAEIGAFNGAALGAITRKIQHVVSRAQ